MSGKSNGQRQQSLIGTLQINGFSTLEKLGPYFVIITVTFGPGLQDKGTMIPFKIQ